MYVFKNLPTSAISCMGVPSLVSGSLSPNFLTIPLCLKTASWSSSIWLHLVKWSSSSPNDSRIAFIHRALVYPCLGDDIAGQIETLLKYTLQYKDDIGLDGDTYILEYTMPSCANYYLSLGYSVSLPSREYCSTYCLCVLQPMRWIARYMYPQLCYLCDDVVCYTHGTQPHTQALPGSHYVRMRLIKAHVWVGRIVDDIEKSSMRRWLRCPNTICNDSTLDSILPSTKPVVPQTHGNRWLLLTKSSVAMKPLQTWSHKLQSWSTTIADTATARLLLLSCFLSNMNDINHG